MSTEEEEFKVSRISYQVSPQLYYSLCIGVFTILIVIGIFITDITIIFGFLGAFVESLFNFFLPAVFYLRSNQIKQKKPDPVLRVISYLFILFGVALFLVANYNNVRKFQMAVQP